MTLAPDRIRSTTTPHREGDFGPKVTQDTLRRRELNKGNAEWWNGLSPTKKVLIGGLLAAISVFIADVLSTSLANVDLVHGIGPTPHGGPVNFDPPAGPVPFNQ